MMAWWITALVVVIFISAIALRKREGARYVKRAAYGAVLGAVFLFIQLCFYPVEDEIGIYTLTACGGLSAFLIYHVRRLNRSLITDGVFVNRTRDRFRGVMIVVASFAGAQFLYPVTVEYGINRHIMFVGSVSFFVASIYWLLSTLSIERKIGKKIYEVKET